MLLPDIFRIRVDGRLVFSETFGGHPETAPKSAKLKTGSFYDDGGLDSDDVVYNFKRIESLSSIPHFSSTIEIALSAGGLGWQGGNDESWAIDAIEVKVRNEGCTDGSLPLLWWRNLTGSQNVNEGVFNGVKDRVRLGSSRVGFGEGTIALPEFGRWKLGIHCQV